MQCYYFYTRKIRHLPIKSHKVNLSAFMGKPVNSVVSHTDKFQTYSFQTVTLPYNFLHVTPPMSPPACLTRCEELVNEEGYLDVDRHTLQHRRYCNVFGVGDCISSPNSKTAAAVGELLNLPYR